MTEIVVGPQGALRRHGYRGRISDRGRRARVGLSIALEVLILVPLDPATRLFLGEWIWFDRGAIGVS